MRDLQSRIKAVMIGHAVGDALGVPVEFWKRETLENDPVTDMRGYGSYDVPAGAWSDDTSMSVAALDSLADGRVDYDEIMGNFVKWIEDGRYTPAGEAFDIGRTCLAALRRYRGGGVAATECGLTEELANGNGSLMRIHPFSMMSYYCGDVSRRWQSVIEEASALTHAHERSKLACKIYTFLMLHLLDIPSKESVRIALAMANNTYRKSAEYESYARLFSVDFELLPREEIRSSGYVVDTLEAATWCLLTTDSYRACVLKAVNLGGDTDTVAAVAGGLAGALYGYEAIPEAWRDTLIGREAIEEICERASRNWR